MIEKLRRKITLVLMCIFSVLLVGVLVSINLINFKTSREKAQFFMEKVLENDGEKMKFQKGKENDLRGDSLYRATQFYSVKTGGDGSIISIRGSDGAMDDEEIGELVVRVLEGGKSKGLIGHILYITEESGSGKIIVFLDNTVTETNNMNLLRYSVIFGGGGLIVLFFVSRFLSKWIVKPVKESFDKQKQFISDASHELKTPIAVIGANADILEGDFGKNKWLSYIQSEVGFMDSLVNKLLTLAKLDSGYIKQDCEILNLSKIVTGAVMPFESIAFEKGIQLKCQIASDVVIHGDGGELKQVTAILVDNALKHTEKGGIIDIVLYSKGRRKILDVMNTGKEIPLEERERIFERFYRGDKSRNRNDKRYGLGLAIAKSMVENHKGIIKVECEDGWTKFKITL